MQALPYEGPDLHILELSGISAEEPIDSASRAPFTWAYKYGATLVGRCMKNRRASFLAFHDKESCLFAINELNGQLHQAAIGANVGDEVEIKAAYGFTSDWYFLHGETLGSTSDSTLRVAIPPNPAFAAAFASPQPEVAAALGLSSPVPSPLAGRDPPTLLAAATEAEANNNGVSSPRELSVPLTKASPPSLQHGQASEEGVAMVDGHDEKPPRIELRRSSATPTPLPAVDDDGDETMSDACDSVAPPRSEYSSSPPAKRATSSTSPPLRRWVPP